MDLGSVGGTKYYHETLSKNNLCLLIDFTLLTIYC